MIRRLSKTGPRRRARSAFAAALAGGLVATGGALPVHAGAAAVGGATSVEAESLDLPASAGAAFSDGSASGGRGLLLWSDSAATGSVTTGAVSTQIRVVARGDQCDGPPELTLTVDGLAAGSVTVASTTWRAYSFTGTWRAGTHRIAIGFGNDVLTAVCDRNLRVDRVAPDTARVRGPWAGLPLDVDPDSSARQQADANRSTDPWSASQLDKIAGQPDATWFGDWLPAAEVTGAVRARTSAATARGAVPVLVTYAIAHRDCGGYSGGGTGDASTYGSWVRAFADGLGLARAVVVLEPDSLAQLDCLAPATRDERLAMLRDAVAVLGGHPGAVVYLDAGNSSWIGPDVMAERLRQAGVAAARGFATNVANFNTTGSEVAYADRISALTGGSHYVVDVSRNGVGPASGSLSWCNPPGRALGTPPTTATASAYADAYLWVKRVGESDGGCGRGEPPAGTWWPAYAVGLASRAAW